MPSGTSPLRRAEPVADKVVYQLPSEGDFRGVELDDGRRYRKQLVKFGAWVNHRSPQEDGSG